MTFLGKFLIFTAFIAVTYGNPLTAENVFELHDRNCSCDWRYFKHYETKGCLVEVTDSCGCPQKFACPSNETQQTTVKVCTYQNKEYKVGSKIISSDFCQVCRCHDGVPPYISCITRECPDISSASEANCHLVYEENRCCPVGVECLENEADATSNETCEYNGSLYPFGSKIYPVDDPCQTCLCDEQWNDGDNSSCYQQDCMFEKNKFKLDAGCIPVYHESRCCPVEFYCPSIHNFSYSAQSNNESADNISYNNQCTFADHLYELGEELLTSNPCVKCSCLVPPDLTCVHQTCPASPSEGSCYANYNSGECCPSYECMLGDNEVHPAGCPTPICADSSCRIEIPPGHDCPTCVCGEITSELEHNNLEQQAQQVPQNIEQQFEHIQEAFEPRVSSDDYSEDELQMMPIRMQVTEEHLGSQLPVMEKILSEFDSIDQYPEAFREMEESSFEENFSTEGVSTSEGNLMNEDNSTSLPELDLDETFNNSLSSQSEKGFQKRSDVSDAANSGEIDAIPVQQEAIEFSEDDIEREGGNSTEKNTDFDDELESFKNKIFAQNKTIINEVININHIVKVPPGCPTPMCEGPWCKIGILPGEKCPTCICKRHNNEP